MVVLHPPVVKLLLTARMRESVRLVSRASWKLLLQARQQLLLVHRLDRTISRTSMLPPPLESLTF